MRKVKFEDVATRVNTREDKDNTSLLYYVGGDHIESGEMVVHNRGLIAGSTIGPMFYFGFKKGDILLVSRNPHLRKASMVNFDGICSEKTFVIGTKDESVLLQRYLAVVVQTDSFWNYCEEHKSGGVNFFVNWSTLAKYEFELPDIVEQRIISDKVWAAYEVKESYRKLISATDEIVKSRFIEQFDSLKKTALSEIAADWDKGQAFKKECIVNEGNTPCIHYGELFKYGPIIDTILSWTNESPIKSSAKGDILFPASDVTPNGLARCSALMSEGVLLGGDIIVLRLKSGFIPEFVSYAINMQKDQLIRRVTGSVVRHMSAKSLNSVEIPIPAIADQKQFIDIIRQADKSKFELKQAIEKIDKVMRALMQ